MGKLYLTGKAPSSGTGSAPSRAELARDLFYAPERTHVREQTLRFPKLAPEPWPGA